jgi:hypothetical protein
VTGTVAPPGGVDDRRVGRRLGVGPERLRQGLHQLAQGGLGLVGHRGGRTDEQEQGLGLGGRQPAEVGAGPAQERPAPAPPGLGVDGDAGGRQRLEVAAGGGHRHLELGGQLGRGHPAAPLEQEEGGDEAVGAHGSIFSSKVLTG